MLYFIPKGIVWCTMMSGINDLEDGSYHPRTQVSGSQSHPSGVSFRMDRVTVTGSQQPMAPPPPMVPQQPMAPPTGFGYVHSSYGGQQFAPTHTSWLCSFSVI